ncbi:hypothetical protein [Paeniglutamicibacter gangotriensis]|uniref:Uncharacterized protein n=1 Tax=Paeniglutamicibacter gangotriensis Lz1y TaxID=1276920 RepID=M7NEH0_9MICC|nr:hypothetical protein [Paeniglutamicibacter gangotriensis]EMR00200.1 hypothetical protein ADIAG_00207 [Paeniglutamicibacter gangotriensis Lz1y]
MARQSDWKKLAGRRVELCKGGQLVRTGFVQEVLDSSDVLWLEAEGFRQRTMIDKSMGFTIRPVQDHSLN